jgi:Amt family ammonium transporter
MRRGPRLLLLSALVVAGLPALAGAAPATPAEVRELLGTPKVVMDTIWTLVTGMLVFFMNLGFAALESGLCRAKNCVNVLAKNFVVFGVVSLAFLFVGWGLMFGNGTPFVGTEGLFFVGGPDNSPATGDGYAGAYGAIAWTGVPLWTKFFFQLAFAGVATTIVSGAVAERIKFLAFFAFSFLMAGFIYPVTGHWIWGGGWLADSGFWDFAGSTVVHSVGGWAALAGVIMLGPRIGRYRDGRVRPMPGHNMALATIGVFVLWLGWFGFNPGSIMAANPLAIGHIVVATNTSAAAASIAAMLTSIVVLGKADFSMMLNGCLAGLVAITAPCAWVSVQSSIVIGLVAGVLVVAAVLALDRMRLDDPVGALPVHLVNGIWGTLAVGLFADSSVAPVTGPADGLFFGGGFGQLEAQAIGVVAVGAYTLLVAFAAWGAVRLVVGLRVPAAEELEGLDVGEHGSLAYPDFVMHPAGLAETAGAKGSTGGPKRRFVVKPVHA